MNTLMTKADSMGKEAEEARKLRKVLGPRRADKQLFSTGVTTHISQGWQ
jgi:hypothetical protein